MVQRAEDTIYVRKADRIAVRHRHGQVVAVVEIVSPGNKASKNELRTFVEKTANLIMQGIHLLVIDLFPPSKRDPQGIHKAIWDELVEEDFELPADQRLTLAAYDAGPPPVAYVEPIAVGEALPDMPIFLKPDFYVPAPLEETYRTTWDDFFPAPMKRLLEGEWGAWERRSTRGAEATRAGHRFPQGIFVHTCSPSPTRNKTPVTRPWSSRRKVNRASACGKTNSVGETGCITSGFGREAILNEQVPLGPTDDDRFRVLVGAPWRSCPPTDPAPRPKGK